MLLRRRSRERITEQGSSIEPLPHFGRTPSPAHASLNSSQGQLGTINASHLEQVLVLERAGTGMAGGSQTRGGTYAGTTLTSAPPGYDQVVREEVVQREQRRHARAARIIEKNRR